MSQEGRSFIQNPGLINSMSDDRESHHSERDSSGFSKYHHPKRFWQQLNNYSGYFIGTAVALLFIYTLNAGSGDTNRLKLATWNTAAINNNPFEYWVTYDENPNYVQLMEDVENFIENPGAKDIPVHEVFTEDMFNNLCDRMEKQGWENVDVVKKYWAEQYRDRKIVSEFLKDKTIGDKRLSSMPDRVTNTINLADGSQVYRPTPINMYEGDLSSLDKWFDQWMKFMFDTDIQIKGKDSSAAVCTMLKSISRSKYPAVTEEEEKISIPLQTVLGAVFDSILVHMLNTVSQDWQSIKMELGNKLNKGKMQRTLEILERQYSDRDIIFLQEVSAAFVDVFKTTKLSDAYDLHVPAKLDGSRDQNSLILTRKDEWTTIGEVTKTVVESGKVKCGDGDLFALQMTKGEQKYLLASFHGDTNGLQTIPIATAMNNAMAKFPDTKLLFGMDANVYEKQSAKTQNCMDWVKAYKEMGYTSCFGDNVNPSSYTTFNARTYLQPQLNKACKSAEKRECGDVNPKDFIIFYPKDFSPIDTGKDNTGEGKYIEDIPFPTLKFPSDHGILRATVEIVNQ